MKKLLAIILITIFLLTGCGNEEPYVAKIDGVSVTEKDYQDFLLEIKQEVYSVYCTDDMSYEDFWKKGEVNKEPAIEYAKNLAYDRLIDLKIVALQANEIGITEENYQNESDFGQDLSSLEKLKLIYSDYYKYLAQDKADPCGATDDEVKNYISKNPQYKEKMINYYNYKQIFLSTLDSEKYKLTGDAYKKVKLRADNIYEQLKNGTDFTTLMKEFSEDPSKEDGFEGFRLYPENSFGIKAKTILKLKEDEYSAPLELENGFYIYKVFGIVFKTDEEVQTYVRGTLSQQKFDKLVSELKLKHKIKKNKKVLASIKY